MAVQRMDNVGIVGSLIVEGVTGSGERFMEGEMAPESLPQEIEADVVDAHTIATRHLGAARFEWVHDGARLWIVQLHSGATLSSGWTIYPGTLRTEHRFAVELGIDDLRELADRLRGSGEGVVLVGSAGVTSHLGDILRKSRIPSRIESAAPRS